MKDLEKLQKLLAKIPQNMITTYGILAKEMGLPRAKRYVGWLLHRNPDPGKYPCYKVVMSNGELGGYAEGIKKKIRRLRRDGIIIKDGRVEDFNDCVFDKF